MEERGFYPQLEVLIHYPVQYDYQQEEFFDKKSELSGVILLHKHQTVCDEKRDGELLKSVDLGQLMLAGAKDQSEFNAVFLGDPGDAFIDLNKYLATNRLQKLADQDSDPRPAAGYYHGILELSLAAPPTKEGVERVLTVGASDNH